MEIETLEPLVVRKSPEVTGGEFVEFELTLYPQESSSEIEFDLPHERWSIDFPTEHVHPHQEERWRVLRGELAVAVNETERTLRNEDEITLPAGIPHRVWNPSDEPSRVTLEFYPAADAQSLTETLFVLAQLGKVNENGQLNVLQFAVIQAAHPDQLYLSAIPVAVQKCLVTLLAPLGRRLGYYPVYTLESIK